MPTAVITGTNRGIGLELTRRYLARGWRVFALNRGASEELAKLGESGDLTVLRGDLAQEFDLARMASDIGDETIDLLINNAGIMGTDTAREPGKAKQSLYDFDRDEWRTVFEINLFTPVELIALLRERLADNARVVTLSSIMGSVAENSYGGWFAYRSSKAAVNQLMKCVALQLQDRGIVAAAIHPGWVRTDMGGPDADIDVNESADGIVGVIDGLKPEDSGKFLAWDGSELSY